MPTDPGLTWLLTPAPLSDEVAAIVAAGLGCTVRRDGDALHVLGPGDVEWLTITADAPERPTLKLATDCCYRLRSSTPGPEGQAFACQLAATVGGELRDGRLFDESGPTLLGGSPDRDGGATENPWPAAGWTEPDQALPQPPKPWYALADPPTPLILVLLLAGGTVAAMAATIFSTLPPKAGLFLLLAAGAGVIYALTVLLFRLWSRLTRGGPADGRPSKPPEGALP